MKTVYIIAPYTKGDIAVNVKNAIVLFDYIADMGFAPFNPLLFHFQHLVRPKDYESWMKIDEEWLRRSDLCVRLLGESEGGDREEKIIKELKIPLFKITFVQFIVRPEETIVPFLNQFKED